MKMHHHLPLNLVTTVRNPTVLWMVTIFVSKLFTKYLLIQLPTNIIMALLKILFKNVIKTIIMFFTKNQFLMIWNLYKYIHLLVLAAVLPTLAKLVVILKLGLMNILKRIASLIFLNIYTPPQHAVTRVILFLSK